MTNLKPKPTLLALLKAERRLAEEITERRRALVDVKGQIAERMAEGVSKHPPANASGKGSGEPAAANKKNR